jgi:Cu+-exporting ATPase
VERSYLQFRDNARSTRAFSDFLDGSESVGDEQAESRKCFHCGTVCNNDLFKKTDKLFCCRGCLTVFEILSENGLGDFYKFGEFSGVKVNSSPQRSEFDYLDEPGVRKRLADYADDRFTRLRLRLPAMHCVACIWLLENLFRIRAGIQRSEVNFPRREVTISFNHSTIPLSQVVSLLSSLGYEPDLKLADLDGEKPKTPRRLLLQIAIAGFAFGNIMLFSIASYLGLDAVSGSSIQKLTGWFSLFLATPVVVYSGLDYWRAAWLSLREKLLRIEVPIAAGIVAIYGQSVYEVVSGRGPGYFDSLCGLLFFLLSGRLFQQKTFDRLSFDRDYKSFFPLSVTRKSEDHEEKISLDQVAIGDALVIRNGELIPADGMLLSDSALIDYSFVTGESEPVEKHRGEHLYAGGRQVGATIEVKTVKTVSQSYLTSLWNQEAFRKDRSDTLDTLTNRYSQRFTKIILAISFAAMVFWLGFDSSKALKVFTSVLIVACPCALALAAPFTLGTAVRLLAAKGVFLKSPQVIESLAKVNAIVFDKTGTLTSNGGGSVVFEGRPLSSTEQSRLFAIARHSIHPAAVGIGQALSSSASIEEVHFFQEHTGCGIEGYVAGHEIWMGSKSWLQGRHVHVPERDQPAGSVVHVAVDGIYRGRFVLVSAVRKGAASLIKRLAHTYPVALLSGDNDRDASTFAQIFSREQMRFNQTPLDKLEFIRALQANAQRVMMVGDGLNDAGALKQSDTGVAVVERMSAFSPGSDIIMSSGMAAKLDAILAFAKGAVRIVQLSFLLSSIYNIIGVSIATAGLLAPVVCAILMPLSSISVVAFSCGATVWWARRVGLEAEAEALPEEES